MTDEPKPEHTPPVKADEKKPKVSEPTNPEKDKTVHGDEETVV
jgi:hypothetical protein